MRSLKQGQARRLEKIQGRQQSMSGWNMEDKGFGEKRFANSRNSQRKMALGVGHHMARMMKGHI